MHIRPAREDDATLLARAEYDTASGEEGLLVAKPNEIPVSAFRSKIRALARHGLYIVIEDNGLPVGHLLLDPLELAATRHVARLTIVVHPGHTGRGYGRALLRYAVEWAKASAQLEKIELNVRSTNARAIALYESFGFVREGILKNRVKVAQGYVDDVLMALFV